MVRVIVIGVVVILALLILAAVLIYFRKKHSKELALERGWALSGDLTAAQEHRIMQMNAAAATLFAELVNQPVDAAWDPMNLTVIGDKHKKDIATWQQQNAEITTKYRRKGIPTT